MTQQQQVPIARAIVHESTGASIDISKPRAGISITLELIADRMRANLDNAEYMTEIGPVLVNKSCIEALEEIADQIEMLARAYAPAQTKSSMRKWRCRSCGKLILEYSHHRGTLQHLCDRCRAPKVINVLIDGVPQS